MKSYLKLWSGGGANLAFEADGSGRADTGICQAVKRGFMNLFNFLSVSTICLCLLLNLNGCAHNAWEIACNAEEIKKLKDKKEIDKDIIFWFENNLYSSFREYNGIKIYEYQNEQCKNVYSLLKEDFILNKYLNLYHSHPDFGNNDDINKKYLDFLYENGVRHYSEPGNSNLIPCKGNYERTCNIFREIASRVDNYLYTIDENIRLEKLRTEQLCKVKSNDFIYTGKNCQDGLAHGLGTAVGAPGQGKRALDGEFSEGVFVKGKLRDSEGNWYDGPVDSMLNPHGFGTLLDNSGGKLFKGNFVQGKAEGSGVCEYQGATEPCMYSGGRRTDQVHLMRIEVARMEKAVTEARTERERAEQARQQQARQQQAARERAESNNEDRNVIGALFGVATGVAMKNVGGASSGDALQAGMAMFNDVSNNTTSNMQNLNQSKNNSSSQLGGSLYQNKNGLSQQGSDNAFDPQGCGIEATKCGPDSACRDRVYQSPMCNNGSSPYTYDDFLNNTVKKDLRIKANPNIK